MRTIRIASAVTAFVITASVPAWAKTETLKGQIVDQTCYMKDVANKGVDHKMPADTKDCAIDCAPPASSAARSTSPMR